jgi:hypothetical protein
MNLPDRTPRPGVTFRVTLRAGVWSVTKDHVFYGDYFSRDQAIASACYGARAAEATGGEVRVLSGEQLIAHRDQVADPGEKAL